MTSTMTLPDAPELRQRPDGNWDVVTLEDAQGKAVHKLAGPTLLADGCWVFVSQAAANAAALHWWLQQVEQAAVAVWEPRTVKDATVRAETWYDRNSRKGWTND